MKTGNAINGLVLATLALGVALWSFFSASSDADLAQTSWTYEGTSSIEWGQPFIATEWTALSLHQRDGLRFSPETVLTLDWSESDRVLTVHLESGTVIFATLADDFSVNVETDFARVSSQNSTAVVTVDPVSSELQVYAVTHPSLVTLVSNGADLNALTVPTAYRIKIPAAKVTSTLARLRLTKLIKEFPVYALADGDFDEETLTALSQTKDSYARASLDFMNLAQEQSDFGPSLTGIGSNVSSGYASFEDGLTVIPSAEEQLSQKRLKEAFVYALSHYLHGDSATGDYWLSQWSAGEHGLEELQVLYSSLFFVLPGDDLYPVKAAVSQVLYPHEDPWVSLRRQYGQIESLLDRSDSVEADAAYSLYQSQFEQVLQSQSFDNLESLNPLQREYGLLELLLRSHSVFYTTEATHLLTEMESKILSLAGSDHDSDEERQSFVQSKLRFLANLFKYVEEKKVSVKEASDLANDLIFSATAYLDSISSQVAVRDYFESQLEEYTLSVQFMNSPEFYSYASFEEGLADYQKKVTSLSDLNAYIQSIRSGEDATATLSLTEATQTVQTALSSNHIQITGVNPLGDSAHRLFELTGARASGYSFEAKYDRETQILYDVVVGDLRFSTGLALETAAEVIRQSMGSQSSGTVEDGTEEGVNAPSLDNTDLSEKVALENVAQQFEAAGLDPKAFDFTIIDLKENLFSFEGVMPSSSVPISGAYDAHSGKVTELLWEFNGTAQSLPDTKLDSLEVALEAMREILLKKGE